MLLHHTCCRNTTLCVVELPLFRARNRVGQMPRPHGSQNIATVKFKELLAAECDDTGTNPVRVLVKLLRSRDRSIRLQAARVLLPFWFQM